MTTIPTVLVADPPWMFRDSLPGRGRGAAKHYRCMRLADLCAMPTPTEGDHNSVLFLWRVASMQPEALKLAAAWGYTVKSELVWQKITRTGLHAFGMGHYTRASHEVCLIATRGSALPAVRNVRSTFDAPIGPHSAKPTAFYRLVQTLYPHSMRYELFARAVRPGFVQFGDQLGSMEATQ